MLGRPKNERHDMQINQRDRLASLSFELLFKSSIKEIVSLFHIFGSIHIYGSCLIHKFAINHMFRIPILQVFQPTNADFKKKNVLWSFQCVPYPFQYNDKIWICAHAPQVVRRSKFCMEDGWEDGWNKWGKKFTKRFYKKRHLSGRVRCQRFLLRREDFYMLKKI